MPHCLIASLPLVVSLARFAVQTRPVALLHAAPYGHPLRVVRRRWPDEAGRSALLDMRKR